MDLNGEVDLNPALEDELEWGTSAEMGGIEGEVRDEDSDLLSRINETMASFAKDAAGGTSVEEPQRPAKPVLGMTFETGVEFVAHMHLFAYYAGFGVTVIGSEVMKEFKHLAAADRARKNPLWYDVENRYKYGSRIRMACRKGGKFKSKSKNPNRVSLTCKTECVYVVTACRCLSKGDYWRITTIEEEHNHIVDPELSRHLPRYRRIKEEDQVLAMDLRKSGVRMCNLYSYFVDRHNGYDKITFTEHDLRNFVYFMEMKPLKNSDFAAMEAHFRKMRQQSPGFVYDFQIDEDGKLVSVFWADSRCIAAFQEYGTVVSLDTTFLTNRYKMPFAPFLTVNNFGKTMLLGCALISKEDTRSFEWVFRVWLKCMGKAPQRIITDQDPAIGIIIIANISIFCFKRKTFVC